MKEKHGLPSIIIKAKLLKVVHKMKSRNLKNVHTDAPSQAGTHTHSPDPSHI
jgi:hypothetical protein